MTDTLFLLDYVGRKESEIDEFVRLAWGTPFDDEKYGVEFANCRLVQQNVIGQGDNKYDDPNNPPPQVVRVYEQIDANDRTQVGRTDVSYDQYGRKSVVQEYVQFSDGTTEYEDIVGTSTAPAPNAECVLQRFEAPNDGTLIRWKLTYIDSGELSDISELRFGGKVIIRTIKSLNEIPATPEGYTLVGPGIEYIEGLPLYTYEFAAAAGGGTPGTSGQISQGFSNNQGGDIEFNPASPTSATGEVICTTVYVSPQSTTSNPVAQPSGFVLWAVDVQDESGYRLWTTKSSFGGGNEITVDVQGESDGALVYTVVQNDSDGSLIPDYPGSGTAYNIKNTHTRDNGFFRNVAVWKKLPATQTFKKKVNFTKPGSAVIGGSPIQLTLSQQVTMDILADVEVSYDESQITDAPFTVREWATFYESYTPTDTGVTQNSTQSLGGYLAGASGNSGTNSYYNGILCDSWQYQLGSSDPSSFSLDTKVLDVDNDPYLVDVDGVVVFRRTKVSYDFS